MNTELIDDGIAGSMPDFSNNTFSSREAWLNGAATMMQPTFEKAGYQLPKPILPAMSFPAGGKRVHRRYETYHPSASAGPSCQVLINIEEQNPIEILKALVAALILTLVPPEATEQTQAFREIGKRIGVTKSRSGLIVTAELLECLNTIFAELGPCPHEALEPANLPKKQTTRMLRFRCPNCCVPARMSREAYTKCGGLICKACRQDFLPDDADGLLPAPSAHEPYADSHGPFDALVEEVARAMPPFE